jgi:S1-C subfamily serine protease
MSSAHFADDVTIQKPGDKVRLDVVRNGTKRTVDVTLGDAPDGA